jgi:aconitate hydratase
MRQQDLVTERAGPGGPVRYVDLSRAGLRGTDTAARTALLLAENILRTAEPEALDDALAQAQSVLDPGAGKAVAPPGTGLRIRPTRLLLQDHSGIPVLADVASARRTASELGIAATDLDLTLPVDLVVDHSVEVQASQRATALRDNMAYEFEHNAERFRFLKWAAGAFRGLRIVPPGRGIVHQIHLEALARVVCPDPRRPELLAYDFVLGTDSHTPMVNGLGVLGWGVGGVEAVGVALGGPVWVPRPEIVGVRLRGALRAPATATDLALTVTRELRAAGVVGAMLEFLGPGVRTLSVPDRATVANMTPEYGSTVGMFAVDERTLDYLRLTGRDAEQVALVEAYHRWQGTFGTREDAAFARLVEIELAEVEPVLAGPSRPEQTVRLSQVPASVPAGDGGAVVLAAITSCTNTANSRSMVTAGLVAARAVERGLHPPDWVKTSLTPGSPTVTAHLAAAGLLPALERLGFHVAGYGCGTCIGNSGPLLPEAAELPGRPRVAVLSGNRNFEGRVHADVDAAYLASPPLVVAYALAGEVTRDLTAGPLQAGSEVRLADLWPTDAEVDAALAHLTRTVFTGQQRALLRGDAAWEALAAPTGPLYDWPSESTYVRPTPFSLPAFDPGAPLRGARVLVRAPDLTTTDHISPAGAIAPASVAGRYLRSLGVPPADFGSFGTRRANHDVLLRGVFGNPRFRNALADRPGPYTTHLPSGEVCSLVDAAERYRAEGVPLVILAGRGYGVGSSRDWAAKGPALLGVRAVLARGFERIHRSNLVGVGILPLEFRPGEGPDELGLDGSERLDIELPPAPVEGGLARVRATRADGTGSAWSMRVRLDTRAETAVWRAGGALPAAIAGIRAGIRARRRETA